MSVSGKIVRVTARELGYQRAGGSAGRGGGYWLSTPTSKFSDALSHAGDFWGPVSTVLVEIESADGTVGYGTAGAGSAGAAALIRDHLAPLIIGQDASAIELLWDRMYRATVRFGRRGIAINAISGIDIALWDLKGKRLGVPVYELLGGRIRESVRAYASRLYAMKDLDELRAEAARYRDEGFTMVKQRFGFGPADGEAGIRGNVALVRAVKETVGDDVEVAGDAYMSWDIEYAIRMERELREFDMAWIEEPLIPHDIGAYRRLCEVSQTPIAHGEHTSTKWDAQELLEARAVHILQPDVNRVGGITEAQKIFALAEARGINVVPHSNEMHNLHVTFSKPNGPLAEYFPYNPDDPGAINTIFYEIFSGNAVAEGGRLQLSNAPGLGLDVDWARVDELERRQ